MEGICVPLEVIHVPMWLTGTPSLRMYCTTSICPPSTAQCRAENPVWKNVLIVTYQTKNI